MTSEIGLACLGLLAPTFVRLIEKHLPSYVGGIQISVDYGTYQVQMVFWYAYQVYQILPGTNMVQYGTLLLT